MYAPIYLPIYVPIYRSVYIYGNFLDTLKSVGNYIKPIAEKVGKDVVLPVAMDIGKDALKRKWIENETSS
jgi:hypothetical protein